jgi:hypothetical protein
MPIFLEVLLRYGRYEGETVLVNMSQVHSVAFDNRNDTCTLDFGNNETITIACTMQQLKVALHNEMRTRATVVAV